MEYQFGSGKLVSVPTINLAGNNVTNPSPVIFGALQEVSVDFSATLKELFGLYTFPLAVARGNVKITGKAKFAQINGALMNLVFGETVATGETKENFQESGNTGANNTITVANNSTFAQDLGVQYAANGVQLQRGANAAAGVYTVSANGVYVFAANDANKAVKISYLYESANTGKSFTINNQLLGLAPFFQVVLNMAYQGQGMTLTLNRATSSKFTLATKLEDFLIPEFDFACCADDSGVVGAVDIAE